MTALAWTRRSLHRDPRVLAFGRLWAATLCGFLAIGAVLPVLPRYVRGPLDAGDVAVGIVVGAFAFSAVIGRPIGGRLADRRGRRIIVVAGLLISAVAGLLYLLPFGVAGLLLARLVLGLGDGWVFTAGAAWAIDLAPVHRRAHAIGVFGLAIWGGLTVGPLAGAVLLDQVGYDAVWLFAALTPAVGAAIARGVPERPPAHVTAGAGAEPAPPSRLLPRPVIPPGIALALANVGYGTMAGFVVLHLDDRGIGHGAAAFTAFAAAVVSGRIVAGTLPDRLGALRTAAGAFVSEIVGLVLIAVAPTLAVAIVGAVIMGLGFSLLFPSLAVLAVERVHDTQRGAALGAFTAFFDAGVGLGAPLAGAVAALGGYPAAFWAAAVCAALGLVVSMRVGREAAAR